MSGMGIAPVAQFSAGPSCGRRTSGAGRSKRLTAGQHVPDRRDETAGDLDRGYLVAAFVAELGALALEDRLEAGVAGGRGRRLHERPAQVVGPILAQWPAPGVFAGLVHLRGRAAVADELQRRREAADVADLGGDREGGDPGDA